MKTLVISGAQELENDGIGLLAEALQDLAILDLRCNTGWADVVLMGWKCSQWLMFM